MSAQADFYLDLIAHIKASVGIGAVAGDRVHLERFPLGTAEPVITLETFDSEIEDFLGGDAPSLAMIVVAFNCWSKISVETLQLRDALYTEFKDFAATMNGGTVVKATIFRGDVLTEENPASQLLRRAIRFEFWYAIG